MVHAGAGEAPRSQPAAIAHQSKPLVMGPQGRVLAAPYGSGRRRGGVLRAVDKITATWPERNAEPQQDAQRREKTRGEARKYVSPREPYSPDDRGSEDDRQNRAVRNASSAAWQRRA